MQPLTDTHRIVLESETDIQGWRDQARAMIQRGTEPGQLVWSVRNRAGMGELDFGEVTHQQARPANRPSSEIRIDRAFLQLINTALLHKNEDRFALAYRLLFRMQKTPKLYRNPADADVRKLQSYEKSVRRDIHKMHAFVRFRKVGTRGNREQFIAWFEPEHHIVEAVGPFFRNRFTGMDWIIASPDASIAWDGENLISGAGGCKQDFAQEDVIEEEWRSYYRNIFNPARLKTQAMKSEMPMKYWHNLPEAELIPSLVRQSGSQVQKMLDRETDISALTGQAVEEGHWTPDSLSELNKEMAVRTADYGDNFSVQAVLGEGRADCGIVVVGEQPGDQEDRRGRPFIGPAGELLDRALGDAAIDRKHLYLTNAVKRFKYVQHGKRRIHQTPSPADIKYYRWWLEQETKLIKPRIILALGATAVRALTGRSLSISRTRGAILPLAANRHLLVTVHPSYILRIPDAAGQDIEYDKLVRDLRKAAAFAATPDINGIMAEQWLKCLAFDL